MLLTIGCGSTEKLLKESELNTLNRAVSQSESLLARLESHEYPGTYDVRIHLSFDVINAALKGIEGRSVTLPNDPLTAVTFDSLRVGSLGAVPLVTISATARKHDLIAYVKITCLLQPTSSSTEEIGLQLRIIDFVPKVRWKFFELDKIKFVNTLIAVEVDKIARELPRIRLPVSRTLRLGAPPRSYMRVVKTGDGDITLQINVPNTQMERTITFKEYMFAGDGVTIFGVVDQ